MSETIKCEICDKPIHAVKIHLGKEHPEVSVEDYQDAYPGSPMMSAAAERALKEAKDKKAAGAKKANKVGASTGLFHELYRLGDNPLAKRPNGDPMPVTVMEPNEHAHLIPEYNSGYVYDIDILKDVQMGLEMNANIYLFGHSGLGKSTLFEQVCAATQRPMVRFQHTVDTQYAHIVGQYVVKTMIDAHGSAVSYTEWQWGPLPLAMKNGWLYVADEFDRCPSGVGSVYQAVLEKKPLIVPDAPEGDRIVLPHEHFRFGATGNTNGSGDETGLYQATMQMDAASMERFDIVNEISYLPENAEQAMLMASTPISEDHAKDLVKFTTMVRDRFPEDFDLTIGPRVMLNIARNSINRGSFIRGIQMSYANRLPEDQRKSVMDTAQRIFGE